MTGTMKFLVMGTMPVGSFLGGVLAGSFGSRSTLVAHRRRVRVVGACGGYDQASQGVHSPP